MIVKLLRNDIRRILYRKQEVADTKESLFAVEYYESCESFWQMGSTVKAAAQREVSHPDAG